MAKSLLIVESPTKATTIRKLLGPGFDVKATVGHIMDLPDNTLGVDVGQDFAPHYQVIAGKEKVVSDLKKAAKNAETIYLGPDPDREGEAIAWHIAGMIGGKQQVYRVLFHELTERGISQAMQAPRSLDMNKYESQVTRRILDRLVGYKISPILWKKVRRGLSAGRVQSVALRMIVERERTIQAFTPEEYWSIVATLEGDAPPLFEARLVRYKNKPTKVRNKDEADTVLDRLQGTRFVVSSVSRKTQLRKPVPPFTTSTLQQEGVRKLRLTAKKTNLLAQRLYEGVELGDQGQVGLITYMRTDSIRVAPEAQADAARFIQERFGKDYLPAKPPVYKNRKHTQDAHEAIRPTDPARTPEQLKALLDPDVYKLYDLIWKRFIASQMRPASVELTSIDITAGEYLFRATGTVVKFPGFMALYMESSDEPADEQGEERRLPEVRKDQELILHSLKPAQHFTKAPPRFNEATLVKELEEKGVGRPSTYAAILSNIQDRKYTEKQKGYFSPTELGYMVNDLLVASFPDIMDVQFTAQMEEQLDQVEEGKVNRVDLLKGFYMPFEAKLETAEKEMRRGIPSGIFCEACGREMEVKIGKAGSFLACPGYPECRNSKNFHRDEQGKIVVVREEEPQLGVQCPECSADMVLKKGRYGPFLACSRYPECKGTLPAGGTNRPEPGKPEETDQMCDRCGGRMLIKTSRFGSRFLSCSNYPKCKNAKPLGLGIPCPEPGCSGELAERKSKKGVFYGCNRYPECRFATWSKPVQEVCPQCGSPVLLEKFTKRKGLHLVCPRKECGFSVTAPAE